MSTAASPPPPPVPPPATVQEPARRRWGCLLPFLFLGLFLSLLLNLGALLVLVGAVDNPLETDRAALDERFLLGDPAAKDKIAVVRINGVLTEGGIQYPLRQLEAAAGDPKVRAVVLRIDSPGGTISASEELYLNILNLRDDTGRRFKSTGPKPVSVSMGAIAASGAYYIAVAGKPIAAERTTITGSIGVFVAIPNVAELAHKHGVRLELIKAGGIKASGSLFHEISPQERQTWQDVVDTAYDQFLGTIAANRPALTAKRLRDDVVIERMIAVRDEKGNPKVEAGKPVEALYQRRLADGGGFTALDAQRYGLADTIEDLPAAIRSAAAAHGLASFKAVVYDKHPGLVERLTGLPLGKQAALPGELADVSNTLTPRLWYLAPTADAGLLAAP